MKIRLVFILVLFGALGLSACDAQTFPYFGQRVGSQSSSILVGGYAWGADISVQVRACNFATWKWEVVKEFNCETTAHAAYKIDSGARFPCNGGYVHLNNSNYWQKGKTGGSAMIQMIEKKVPERYFFVSKQADWQGCYLNYAQELDVPYTYNAKSTDLKANCMRGDGSYARVYTNNYQAPPISISLTYTGSSGLDCVKFP